MRATLTAAILTGLLITAPGAQAAQAAPRAAGAATASAAAATTAPSSSVMDTAPTATSDNPAAPASEPPAGPSNGAQDRRDAQAFGLGAGAVALLVALALLLRVVLGLRGGRGKHRAPRTAEQPAEASFADSVENDLALATNPVTGEAVTPGAKLHWDSPKEPVPAPRVLTSAAASTAIFGDDGEPATAGGEKEPDAVPALAEKRELDDDETARIREAYEDGDVDELLALAATESPAAFACNVLAAALLEDPCIPAAFAPLHAAFASNSAPEDDPILAPYLTDLSFRVRADDLGLDVLLPCSRASIGCAVAVAERFVGDFESAYSVLLELPNSPVVVALKAQVALDLDWPTRALRALTGRIDDGDPAIPAIISVLTGAAQSATGATTAAVATLTATLDDLASTPDQMAASTNSELRCRALFERAVARKRAGNPVGSWEDLTTLLKHSPEYPGAGPLLKSL